MPAAPPHREGHHDDADDAGDDQHRHAAGQPQGDGVGRADPPDIAEAGGEGVAEGFDPIAEDARGDGAGGRLGGWWGCRPERGPGRGLCPGGSGRRCHRLVGGGVLGDRPRERPRVVLGPHEDRSRGLGPLLRLRGPSGSLGPLRTQRLQPRGGGRCQTAEDPHDRRREAAARHAAGLCRSGRAHPHRVQPARRVPSRHRELRFGEGFLRGPVGWVPTAPQLTAAYRRRSRSPPRVHRCA